MTDLTPIQTRFVLFVMERESIRLAKEAKKPTPWTGDPILKDYKFCNVNREHDAVTRWIGKHVRPVLAKEKLATAVAQLYLCRIFNEPDTLREIFPLTHPRSALKKLASMREEGRKILRGAYYCVPHGTANAGKVCEEYFMDICQKIAKLPLGGLTQLGHVAHTLKSINGIGDFIANQVCTDLRYQKPWGEHWTDWNTFVLAGPGTRRGLNRYLGAESTLARKFPKLTGDCQDLLLGIRETLEPHFPVYLNAHFKDPNNLSNCFCEFDKYERACQQLASNQRITIRKRHGIHST
jgi:hypothetical protein